MNRALFISPSIFAIKSKRVEGPRWQKDWYDERGYWFARGETVSLFSYTPVTVRATEIKNPKVHYELV